MATDHYACLCAPVGASIHPISTNHGPCGTSMRLVPAPTLVLNLSGVPERGMRLDHLCRRCASPHCYTHHTHATCAMSPLCLDVSSQLSSAQLSSAQPEAFACWPSSTRPMYHPCTLYLHTCTCWLSPTFLLQVSFFAAVRAPAVLPSLILLLLHL